jgi:hypothetical protein
MRREFVAAFSDDSESAINALAARLDALPNVAWCHYMKGLWQIVDRDGTMNPSDFRSEFRELLPNSHVIVFEIQPGSLWSGWVPTGMAKWITDNWQ